MKKIFILGGVLLAVALAIWNSYQEQAALWRERVVSPLAALAAAPATIARIALPQARRALASVEALPTQRFFPMAVLSTPKPPLDVANEYLMKHREDWRLQAYHEFRPQVFESPAGARVVFHVFQDGLPVLGMQIDVQVGTDSSATLMQNNYRPVSRADISTDNVLSVQDAAERASARYSVDPGIAAKAAASVLFLGDNADQPELAYSLPMQERGGKRRTVQVLVRASDGQILTKTVSRSEF